MGARADFLREYFHLGLQPTSDVQIGLGRGPGPTLGLPDSAVVPPLRLESCRSSGPSDHREASIICHAHYATATQTSRLEFAECREMPVEIG